MNSKMCLTVLALISSTQVQSQQIVAYQDCGDSSKAISLAKLLIESEGQHRNNLVCNKVLSQVAFEKAKAMAIESRVDHNINHSSPNELLTAAGIELPRLYEIIGNQVEAVSGGKDNAQDAFNYFMTSIDHKEHLMGENEFYLKQNNIGVGHYYDIGAQHMEYWVVYITALRGDNEELMSFPKTKYVFTKQSAEKRKRFKRGDSLPRAGKYKPNK